MLPVFSVFFKEAILFLRECSGLSEGVWIFVMFDLWKQEQEQIHLLLISVSVSCSAPLRTDCQGLNQQSVV